MGNKSACRECPVCAEDENCTECEPGWSRDQCPKNPFSASTCDTGAIQANHNKLTAAEVEKYETYMNIEYFNCWKYKTR